MTHKEFGESLKPEKFKGKHNKNKTVRYNPICPLNYPKDHVHTILGDSAVQSNSLKNNTGIKGMFCYNASMYDDESYK